MYNCHDHTIFDFFPIYLTFFQLKLILANPEFERQEADVTTNDPVSVEEVEEHWMEIGNTKYGF